MNTSGFESIFLFSGNFFNIVLLLFCDDCLKVNYRLRIFGGIIN